jgi:glycosyltransferase involved in cell wall biosynthesis
VHWRAFSHYRGQLAGRFDAVIDQVNTMPFFTRLWADVPSVMLIHQLAREVWWYESRFPINALGYAAEPLYLRPYRKAPVFTISSSTERDLRALGFSGPITVVPIGVDAVDGDLSAEKPRQPTFLYVGRLAPSKRVDHILEAFSTFTRAYPSARLSIVGEGDANYERRLRSRASELGISRRVQFRGRVDIPTKQRLMAQAHMLLLASAREGWGLVVTEANACGTPAVVYDVAGLRDSVRHESTGLVVAPRPDAMAAGMERLWRDRALYDWVSGCAQEWARTFTFDRTASDLRDGIAEALA